jgi:Flp pilus assembly protein TadG
VATIKRRVRRGIALIWVAVIALAVIGLAGLALDTGYSMWAAHRLQIAADAAALAGASQMSLGADYAQNAAQTISAANKVIGNPVHLVANPANALGGDIVVGRYDSATSQFTATLASPNAVMVTARLTASSPNGPLALNFGPAFGINSINLTRSAIAFSGGGVNAGLVILDGSAPAAFSVVGNANITVSNGAIQVNSDSSSAIQWRGNVNVNATELDVVGGLSTTGNTTFGGPVNTGAPAVDDPLATLPAPVWNPAADQGAVNLSGNETRNLQPGYYSGGITASGNTALNFAPGIYVLGGAGIGLTGNAALTARGVMIYLTGTAGIQFNGNGNVILTPPDPSLYSFPGADTYAGIAIFQARDNDAADKFTGNSNLNIQGTIYMSKAQVTIVGNASTLGNQVVVGTIHMTGNSSLGINYDGRNALAGHKSWLVQ